MPKGLANQQLCSSGNSHNSIPKYGNAKIMQGIMSRAHLISENLLVALLAYSTLHV